jgi:hypothetical protein
MPVAAASAWIRAVVPIRYIAAILRCECRFRSSFRVLSESHDRSRSIVVHVIERRGGMVDKRDAFMNGIAATGWCD